MTSEDSPDPVATQRLREIVSSLTPFRMLAILTAAVFVIELLLMAGFHYFLPPYSEWLEGILDAAVLTILLFPILHFLVFRPLTLLHAQQMAIQHKLEKQVNELQRFHKIAISRELRLKELYEENQALKARLGEQQK